MSWPVGRSPRTTLASAGSCLSHGCRDVSSFGDLLGEWQRGSWNTELDSVIAIYDRRIGQSPGKNSALTPIIMNPMKARGKNWKDRWCLCRRGTWIVMADMGAGLGYWDLMGRSPLAATVCGRCWMKVSSGLIRVAKSMWPATGRRMGLLGRIAEEGSYYTIRDLVADSDSAAASGCGQPSGPFGFQYL